MRETQPVRMVQAIAAQSWSIDLAAQVSMLTNYRDAVFLCVNGVCRDILDACVEDVDIDDGDVVEIYFTDEDEGTAQELVRLIESPLLVAG